MLFYFPHPFLTTFRFLRGPLSRVGSSSGAQGNSVTSSSFGSGSGSGGAMSSALSNMNPLKMFGTMSGGVSGTAGKSTQPTNVLTEEEKKARREKLSAAAQDRSQVWDKKLGQKKYSGGLTSASGTAGISGDPTNDTVGPINAETERAIQRTKQLEVKIEKVGVFSFLNRWKFS